MSNADWEHAVLEKQFTVYYGNEEDIHQHLASLAASAPGPTA
jgi:hypothetical protein